MDIRGPNEPSRTFLNLDAVKQRRIVDAALKEFSEHGYEGASINRLVFGLGISKGSIFKYFRNKNSLFLFVFEHALRLVKDELRKVRSDTNELEVFDRIRQALLNGIRFVRKNPKISSIYFRILFESGIPMRRDLIRTLRTLSMEYLLSILEEGRVRGEIRESVDLRKAAFFLDALLDRFLQVFSVKYMDAGLGLHLAEPEIMEAWADELVDFLRRGLGR